MIRLASVKIGPLWRKGMPEDILREETTRALTEIGIYGEKKLQDATWPFTNTGHLENSMHYRVKWPTVRIGTPVNYGVVVLELGRRPGTMPPVAPLKLWVKRKLKPHVEIVETGGRTRTRQLRGDVADRIISRVAWAIAYAIKKRGQPARYLVSERVYPMVMLRAQTYVRDAAKRIAKRIGL